MQLGGGVSIYNIQYFRWLVTITYLLFPVSYIDTYPTIYYSSNTISTITDNWLCKKPFFKSMKIVIVSSELVLLLAMTIWRRKIYYICKTLKKPYWPTWNTSECISFVNYAEIGSFYVFWLLPNYVFAFSTMALVYIPFDPGMCTLNISILLVELVRSLDHY